MTGLINLISENMSKLTIIPILAFLIIIATLVIFYYFRERKIVKYIPSLIIGVIALVIGIYSITIFTDKKGLNIAWIAVFLGTTALCGVLTGFVIDLVNSIRKSYKKIEKGNKWLREKQHFLI